MESAPTVLFRSGAERTDIGATFAKTVVLTSLLSICALYVIFCLTDRLWVNRAEGDRTGPKSLTWLTDAGLNQGGAAKSWREHMAPQTFLGTVGSLEILGILEGVLLGLDGLCPPTTITERD